VDGEPERRPEYERVFSELRVSRRALETARARGADAIRLRRRRDRLRDLHARLAALQCGLEEQGTR
jgi:hypothetical protein